MHPGNSAGPIRGIGIETRKKVWDYDLVRKLLQQIRQVPRCYLGDYHPLTPYSQEASVWAAYQFDLPETGEGVVSRTMSPFAPPGVGEE